MSLASLKADILEDNIVDEAEVERMRAVLLDDGVIDREEANFLFEINDATSGNENHASWPPFFVDSLAAHVLEDETSPGEVDEDEATYLKEKIHGDGKVDDNEKALLIKLKADAKGPIPGSLQFLFDMYL